MIVKEAEIFSDIQKKKKTTQVVLLEVILIIIHLIKIY